MMLPTPPTPVSLITLLLNLCSELYKETCFSPLKTHHVDNSIYHTVSAWCSPSHLGADHGLEALSEGLIGGNSLAVSPVAFALPSLFNSIYDAVKINAKYTNKSSLKSWHKFSLEVLSLKTRKVQFAASSFQEQQYLLPQIAEGSKCCKPKGSNSRLSQILHLLWVFFLLGWVLFLFLFVSWPPCQCMPVIWLYQSPLGFPGYNHFPRNWGSLNNKSRCQLQGSAGLWGIATTKQESKRTVELKRHWLETSQLDPLTSITHQGNQVIVQTQPSPKTF